MTGLDSVALTKRLLQKYPLLKVNLRSYLEERADVLLGTSGDPVISVGGRGRRPSDPTLRKVTALERVDERHATILFIFRTVERALKRADATTRRLVEMHYFEGRTLTAASAHLGIHRVKATRMVQAFVNNLERQLSEYLWHEREEGS